MRKVETEAWSAEEGAQMIMVQEGTRRGSVGGQGLNDEEPSSSSTSGMKDVSEEPGIRCGGHFAPRSAIYAGYINQEDGESENVAQVASENVVCVCRDEDLDMSM